MIKICGSGKSPTRASPGSCGYDLYSNEDKIIMPFETTTVSTGISVEIELNDDFYIRIAPRSGLAVNSGIDVFAGVVDEDYRGEIKVVLFNSKNTPFHVKKDDKIAQFIIERCIIVDTMIRVDSLSQTTRGFNGFGSSG